MCLDGYSDYKKGVSDLVNVCDSLITKNNAHKLTAYYRVGWDSISVSYTMDSSHYCRKFTKKEPKKVISPLMVLGAKSYSFSYAQGEYLGIPYSGPNHKYQESRFLYCFNQEKYINEHYSNLDKFYELNSILENKEGIVYIIDEQWIIVIK